MTMQPELPRCSAVRCQAQIKRKLLMCPRHWELVPLEIQRDVHKTVRAFNNGGSEHAYLLAVSRAQLAVVEHEDLPYGASIRDKITALEGHLSRSKSDKA